MSKCGQLKKKWAYEPSVPRCGECTHFRETYIKLTTNSQTKRVNRHCSLGGFTVAINGVCDKWADKNGVTLEAA